MTAILLTLTVIRGVGSGRSTSSTARFFIIAFILLPSMLVGIFIGDRFHHGISELGFRRTVAGALIARAWRCSRNRQMAPRLRRNKPATSELYRTYGFR